MKPTTGVWDFLKKYKTTFIKPNATSEISVFRSIPLFKPVSVATFLRWNTGSEVIGKTVLFPEQKGGAIIAMRLASV